MLRTGLRRCAPIRRTCLSIAPTVIQCQARILQAKPLAPASVLPGLRSAFHQYRALRQEVAEAEDVDIPAEELEKPEPMRFRELQHQVHPNLIRAITDDMRYEFMSEVQEKTITPGIDGFDMVAQAKTGTGKTIAFLLPMLQRMIDEDPSLAKPWTSTTARSSDIRGIVLSPTRELAEQIVVEAKKLVSHTGLVVQAAVGGKSKYGMLKQMQREGCHLLVATPGRLLDLLSDTRSKVAAPNLAAFVLDEADRMLDVGFAPTLADIQRLLPDVRQKSRQTLLFSATIPKDVIGLAKNLVRQDKFQFVQTIRHDEAPTHEKVPQHVVVAESHMQLYPALYELMDREYQKSISDPDAKPFKAIVYFRATALVEMMQQLDGTIRRNRRTHHLDPRTFVIYGKLRQEQRDNAAKRFRYQRSAILFSSDVTARGMDFPDVTHVIQVGLPPDREQYIHRLGRTGRQGKDGKGYLLVTKSEAYEARTLLKGLKVEQDLSLVSATVSGEGENVPEIFEEVSSTFARMDPEVLRSVYLASFATVKRTDVMDHLESMHKWIKASWEWEEPPSVSRRWVEKMGFKGFRGFNVADREPLRRGSGGDRFGIDDRFGQSGDEFVSQFRDASDGGFGSSNRGSSQPWMKRGGNQGTRPWGRGGGRSFYGRNGDNLRRPFAPRPDREDSF